MPARSYEIRYIKYEIRPARKEDMPSLLAVKNDLTVHKERLRQQEKGNATYYCVIINSVVAGFVFLSFDNKEDVMTYTNQEKCADMIDVFIIMPLRGFGIGSRLVSECESACRTRGIPYIGVDINPDGNPRAKKFCESLGYISVGRPHLDWIYECTKDSGVPERREEWCMDMIKKL